MVRDCIGCVACCYNTKIAELNKPERVMCNNCDGHGCSIYEDRPAPCVNFNCAWMQGELFDNCRPAETGVMVENFGSFRFVMCDGDEWKNMTNVWEVYVRKNIPVVIVTKTNKIVLKPAEMNPEYVMNLIKEAQSGSNDRYLFVFDETKDLII